MRFLAGLLLILLALASSEPAQAQLPAHLCTTTNNWCWTTTTRPNPPAPGQWGFNTTLNSFEGYNGISWTQFDPGTGVNVASFGACQGSSNDAPFINAAIEVIRALNYGRLTAPSSCLAVTTSGVNFTDLDAAGYVTPSPLLPVGVPPGPNAQGIIIDIGSMIIDCQFVDGTCIDATNTKNVYWNSFTMVSHAFAVPNIGFQYGSPCWNTNSDPDCPGNTGIKQITASQNVFIQNSINGFFKTAAKINFSSEGSAEIKGAYRNFCDGVTTCIGIGDTQGMGYIIDCQNHFNQVSSFTTIFRSGTDQLTGCQAPGFYDTVIQTQRGSDLWLSGTFGLNVDRSSYFSVSGSNPNVTIFNNGTIFGNSAGIGQLNIEAHIEGTNAPAKVLFTGPNSPYVIQGLRMWDTGSQASFAEFALDFSAGVTSVGITNLYLNIPGNGQNANWRLFGAYQKVATAAQATGGSGCTNGSQTFTVSGGTGIAATLTGTVSGNSLASGAMTITTAGTYQTTPGTPVTLTGGGCSVAPTATITYNATTPPFGSVTGDVYAFNSTQLGVLPAKFGGTACAENACAYVVPARSDSGPGAIVGNNAQIYAVGDGIMGFATAGALQAAMASGGTWIFGASGAAALQTNNIANPKVQNRVTASLLAPYRGMYGSSTFAADAFSVAGDICAKSRSGALDVQTIVQNNDALCRFSMQGSDGNKFQEAAAIRVEADAAPTAGSSSQQGNVPGRMTLSTAGGTFYAILPGTTIVNAGSSYTPGSFDVTLATTGGACVTPPQINVTAGAGGTITSVNSITVAGVCATPPTNPNTPTGGAGSGLTLTVQYSNQRDGVKIDSAQGVFINPTATPTGKRFACIDATTGQVYVATAGGAC